MAILIIHHHAGWKSYCHQVGSVFLLNFQRSGLCYYWPPRLKKCQIRRLMNFRSQIQGFWLVGVSPFSSWANRTSSFLTLKKELKPREFQRSPAEGWWSPPQKREEWLFLGCSKNRLFLQNTPFRLSWNEWGRPRMISYLWSWRILCLAGKRPDLALPGSKGGRAGRLRTWKTLFQKINKFRGPSKAKCCPIAYRGAPKLLLSSEQYQVIDLPRPPISSGAFCLSFW